MPVSIVIPQLGESVVEGTVAKWLKAEGDAVKIDEPIVEIATDKISIEIPAPAAGTLGKILVQEGATLPVGTEIGSILGAGESAGAAAPAAAPAPAAAAATPAPAPAAAAAAPSAPSAAPAAAPARAGAPAAVATMPAAPSVGGVNGHGGDGDREPSRTSPAVRRLAREHNVDLSRITGSGAGGRITRDDVQAFIDKGGAGTARVATPAAPAVPAPSYYTPPAQMPYVPQPSALEEVVPMTNIRKAISEAMTRSKYTAPEVTTFDEVEMTAVANIRARLKDKLAAKGVKLSYTPFFLKAAAMALRDWPIVNSSVVGDTIVYKKYYNIGVAVGADRGLIVPVIRDCDRKTVIEIARELEDLGARAHSGKVTMDEIRGGTFTVTNAGAFGAKQSTPIIAYPEVAILGVHAIEKRPVVRNDEVVVRLMSSLAVTFDHRIIDGHIAVQFLRQICESLENPEMMVVGA